MNWFLVATIFGVACAQPLLFRPYQSRENQKTFSAKTGDRSTTWFENSPAVTTVKCPDGKTICPDGCSCCKLTTTALYICCPPGFTCDSSTGMCNSVDDTHWSEISPAVTTKDWSENTPAVTTTDWSENTPTVTTISCSASTTCPDETTCCQIDGQYYCCPYANAVCCSDGLHCCPQGDTCDVSAGTCSKDNRQRDWFEKTPAKQLKNVICPDGQSQCPDGDTCCQLPSGEWGCCPYPNAVCCSDGLHCCPQGETCDVSAGTCSKDNIQRDWFVTTPAKQLKNVICPDAQSQCPDGDTCCQLPSGEWGCCPYPNAVCCSDGEHCCPQGKTCDLTHGKCIGGDVDENWAVKSPALRRDNVYCDATHQCPVGSTCCKGKAGQWKCCPTPYAKCCSDGIHCCPQGTTCDVSTGTCNPGDLHIDWAEKTPARQLEYVICPDGQTHCPDGYTCCKIPLGTYGCCPSTYPVCCSDGIHCCPQGTTCDPTSTLCNGGDHQIPWAEKTPARKLNNVKPLRP